jgi:dTDP-glucose pyrophosphorylase
MAGAGSRFHQAGYSFPKPLIDVAGKPMIQRVTENLPAADLWVFVAQRDHVERYHLRDMLARLVPDPVLVEIDGVTDGAACTALTAAEFIGPGELLIANSDQIVDWDPAEFVPPSADGAILTFESTHPKWSFVRSDSGVVSEVAEKRPISDRATCGVYWWRDSERFVACAEAMVADDERAAGEFYIAPVYNRLIADGGRVVEVPVRGMSGLGTPEDLEAFLRRLG